MTQALMLRFLLVFSGISFGICGFVYFVFYRRLGLSKIAKWYLLSFLFFAALSMTIGPIYYRTSGTPVDDGFSRAFQYTQYFLMGWAATNFLVFIVLEFLQLLAKPFDPQKRIFLTEGVTRGIVTATTLTSFAGLAEAKMGPSIVPVGIKLPELPPSFSGLTVAQISDVHIGPLLDEKFLDGVVDQVMSLNADIILITGDLVDGTVEQLKGQMEPLKRLKAREGVYFCTGNHEFYSGVQEWTDYLESIGIHVFKNTNVVLSRSGKSGFEKILLSGVYDFQGEKYNPQFATDPKRAAMTAEPVSCKLLMAHNPYSIDGATEAGFHFQFSGHTHAGQFYPFAFLVRFHLKHFEGYYRINDKTQLYVNRGTGYWGPPNRFGKRSEITHFTFTSS